MHPYNQDHLPLQGIILLTLIATLDSLRPKPCDNGSSLCIPPSKLQYGVLYTSLALSCIGSGGTRFTIATMGAIEAAKHHRDYTCKEVKFSFHRCITKLQ